MFDRINNIPIKIVINSPDSSNPLPDPMTEAYVEAGTLINSSQFDNQNSENAKTTITTWLEENKLGPTQE